MGFDRNLLPDPTSYFESQGLKLIGPRSAAWKTTECRFHGGSDSMRINTENGIWKCMNCDVKGGNVLAYQMKAYGMDFQDACKALRVPLQSDKPSRKPAVLSARDALRVTANEANLVAIAACNVAHGVVLTAKDKDRLLKAAARIIRLEEEFNDRR